MPWSPSFWAIAGACDEDGEDERPGRRRGRARAVAANSLVLRELRPETLRRSVVPVSVVCGPPCAGKSSLVAALRAPEDMVLDLDEIAAGLGAASFHCWSRDNWLLPALRERNARLAELACDPCRWAAAWLIVSAPEAAEREWWAARLEAQRVIVVTTPIERCWKRAESDAAREPCLRDTLHGIDEWFNRYSAREADTLMPGGCAA